MVKRINSKGISMRFLVKFFPVILVVGCSSNYQNHENTLEFEKEKINFIAGCSESGTLSPSVCECQFDDLIKKYDKEFYKDTSLMEDNDKARKFEKIAYEIIDNCEKKVLD